jgi:hypothetical protein
LLSKQNGSRKSTCKQTIEEKIKEMKAYTIPLKAKKAKVYVVNLFPKEKSTFYMPKTIYLAI